MEGKNPSNKLKCTANMSSYFGLIISSIFQLILLLEEISI